MSGVSCCPHESLDSVIDDEFEELYMKYEAEGRFRKKINAQDLWFAHPYPKMGNRNTVCSFIRMPVIESLIRITLEQLGLLISVLRSLNIQMMKRQLFVI